MLFSWYFSTHSKMSHLCSLVLIIWSLWAAVLAYYPVVLQHQDADTCPSSIVNKTELFVTDPTNGVKDALLWNLCVVPRRQTVSAMSGLCGIASYKAAQKVEITKAVCTLHDSFANL